MKENTFIKSFKFKNKPLVNDSDLICFHRLIIEIHVMKFKFKLLIDVASKS